MKKEKSDSHQEHTPSRRNRDDVAKLAGVSSATVSRVYNSPSSVSKSRRDAVLKAAVELGYRPNKAASALGRKGGNLILFVELDHSPNYFWGSPMFYSWYYAEALQGAMSVVEESLFSLSPVRLHRIEDLSGLVRERQPAGILFFDAVQKEILSLVEGLGVPSVLGHHVEVFDSFAVHRVMTDNYRGAWLAGDYLRRSGHKHSVYIASATDSSYVHQRRWHGFRDGFIGEDAEENSRGPGLDRPEVETQGRTVRLLPCDPGKQGGFQAGLGLVEQIKNGKLDSIGVVNDYTAMGVILALFRNDLQVPRQVSIISYDNLPFSEALPFQLSTIDLRIREIYRRAAECLLSHLHESRAKTRAGLKYQSLVVLPELFEGESVIRRN